MQNFKKLVFLLDSHEKKRAVFLLIMIIIMAFLEMVGIAAIFPFIAVLTDPSVIEKNFILNFMFQVSSMFGVQNNEQFIFALGVILFFILIISLFFKVITTYLQIIFMGKLIHSISKRFVEGYLHQPYSWFLKRNSTDLGKNILSEVGNVVGNGIGKLVDLITKGAVTISIIILLIIVDFKLALIVSFSIILTYVLIFSFLKTYLKKIGKESSKNNQLRFITISEAFGAVKEVKVLGLEKVYIKSFSNSSQIFARTYASASIIAALPRFFLEAVAFGGILLIILYMMSKSNSFSDALPIIILYAFAGYRLIPAIQVMYAALSQLTFVGPVVDKLYDDLINLQSFEDNKHQGKISFNKTISLKNINYNYPGSSRIVLKDITLNISAKSIVGFVGPTGSGKTTLIDIILGLLEAQKGSLEVDGEIITKQNSRFWQRYIGYVPQHIYLSDDTVSANIAFGVESKNIDQAKVEKVSKIANLHEFVLNELPKQYLTTIGERGVRLSGGQRQRIGIARALYFNPSVLVLDEATSALDNQTEKAVMDGLNNLGKDITIILIAHRLNTVKICNTIFKLEKGQLIAQGTFSDLFGKNINF
jgi:ABC-type branched-subunit amino acid transport system ATPase component